MTRSEEVVQLEHAEPGPGLARSEAAKPGKTREAASIPPTDGLYVQYGCGWSAPSGWLNYDASPTLRFERLPLIGHLYTKNQARFPETVRFGNIVHGLDLPDQSCRGVYCSHVLEHLSLEDMDRALAETYRILAPGGIFRAVVPDLETAARRYLDELTANDAEACSRFMERTHLGLRRRPRGLAALAQAWLGNSRHLWMWDLAGLRARLQARGFAGVRPAAFNDCPDPAFRAVEDAKRFTDACAVEARRPAAA